MKNIGIIFGLIALVIPSVAYADEIVVTENGATSVNTTNSTNSQTTVVEQNNTAAVSTTVTSSSSTGNNTADNNASGNTTIHTGNASSTTDVSTSGNTSVSTAGCCQGEQTNSVTVSGNGAGSVNTGSANQTTTVSQTSNNTISLTNTISGIANTGGNKADNNNGNVLIQTGSVSVVNKTDNGPINTAVQKSFVSHQSNATLKISGNGAGSVNTISATSVFTVSQIDNNIANIVNNIYTKGESGGNSGSFNLGDVVIKTGDVSLLNYIKNGPINTSISEVTCCEEKPHVPETPENPNPPTPPGNGGGISNGGNGGGNGGSSGGANGSSGDKGSGRGQILPVTGNLGYLLAILGNTLLLLFGVYLRLRAGNSPGMFV